MQGRKVSTQAPESMKNVDRQTRCRHVLQMMLIALLASTAFLTGDGLSVSEGMTSWLVLGFIGLGSLWAVYQLKFPEVRYRLSWPAFLLSITVAVMFVSVYHSLGAGDYRAALNHWWQWVAFAVGFTLIIQLLDSARVNRAVVAVMLAVAVSISCIGIYDSLVRIPEIRSEYFQGNAQQRIALLQDAGINETRVGSPGRYHFESRIQSPEPYVTFALTNSLAGFLAPWFTLLILSTLSQQDIMQSQGQLGKLLLLASVLAFCLVLTKSRSACCAVGLSVLIGAGLFKGYRAMAIKVVAALSVLGLLVFALGMLTHRLDSKIITESVKSLSFRMEYWESSSAMAGDHLWTGVGPGNFRDYYTSYKLAAASESIADPHNWMLEVLTSFGLPVLLLLCAVIALAVRQSLKADGVTQENEERMRRLSDNQVYLAGGLGCVLGLAVDQLSYAFIPLSVFYVALPCFAVVIFLLQDWVARGQLNRQHLLIAFICWLVNLCVAGGISYPGVAFSGWLLLGICLVSAQPARREADHLQLPRSQRWSMGLIMGGLTLGVIFTFHFPVTSAEHHSIHASYHLRQNRIEPAREHLQQAIDADPYKADGYIEYANVLFMLLSNELDVSTLEQYKSLVTQALDLNPKSQSSYELFSMQALLMFDRYKEEEFLTTALAYTQRESELYPGSAVIHARLAVCHFLAGDQLEMRKSIDRALELDADNPHLEFKLSNRRLVEVEFAGWTNQQIIIEKSGESVEQILRTLRNKGQNSNSK